MIISFTNKQIHQILKLGEYYHRLLRSREDIGRNHVCITSYDDGILYFNLDTCHLKLMRLDLKKREKYMSINSYYTEDHHTVNEILDRLVPFIYLFGEDHDKRL